MKVVSLILFAAAAKKGWKTKILGETLLNDGNECVVAGGPRVYNLTLID